MALDERKHWRLLMKETINFLIAGVGGQGIILASDVLVNVGLAAGYQAKQAEVHGMSQRGGSVTSYVRWGKVVYSPLVGAGEVDVFLAFEKVEALRYLNQLRYDALVLINMDKIVPVTVTISGQVYPSEQALRGAISQVTHLATYLDAAVIATTLGNPRAANVVLLGALSVLLERQMGIGSTIPTSIWLEILSTQVPPKYLDLNRSAFHEGRMAITNLGSQC
jgi:indolepyruvate ferredoxin oxidoreductase, beta subunit